jgi:AP-2 complex subunit mu-1
MIGVLLFLNSRGDIVLSRAFRDNFNIRQLADTFRLEIIATKRAERCPIIVLDKVCFLHIRFDNMYVVACTNLNVNCIMTFQYMIRLLQIFRNYFEEINEDTLRQHFVVVQQLIDESMDYGYPQMTEVDVLKSFITTGGTRGDSARQKKESQAITVKATGRIPWRGDGISYSDNEVFLDVVEDVNLLMSQSGEVLQREVIGRVLMKCFLSGMPDCRLITNDKMMIDQSTAADGRPVSLDDVTFHACVQLGRFDAERSICFIPPDGEFVLMRYRTSENVNPPFRISATRVKEISKARMEVDFRLKAEFQGKAVASDVVVKVPCPKNTAEVKVRVATGKAKYDPTQKAILWKIKKMTAGQELSFSCEIQLIAATLQSSEHVWSRPPITLQFRINMMAVSGLEVSSLRINEPKLNYNTQRWVRYMSSAGQYQCRL